MIRTIKYSKSPLESSNQNENLTSKNFRYKKNTAFEIDGDTFNNKKNQSEESLPHINHISIYNSCNITKDLDSSISEGNKLKSNFNTKYENLSDTTEIHLIHNKSWNNLKKVLKINPDDREALRFQKSKKLLPSSRRNERERNRVRLINQGFSTLRQHVPTCHRHKKSSKVDTLRAAVNYINQLKYMLEDDDDLGSHDISIVSSTSFQSLDLAELFLQKNGDNKMFNELPAPFIPIENNLSNMQFQNNFNSSGPGCDKLNYIPTCFNDLNRYNDVNYLPNFDNNNEIDQISSKDNLSGSFFHHSANSFSAASPNTLRITTHFQDFANKNEQKNILENDIPDVIGYDKNKHLSSPLRNYIRSWD